MDWDVTKSLDRLGLLLGMRGRFVTAEDMPFHGSSMLSDMTNHVTNVHSSETKENGLKPLKSSAKVSLEIDYLRNFVARED